METWSKWRETTDDVVLEAIDLFANYLIGQTNGMSDSLLLPAVEVVFRTERIPRDDRPELMQRLILVNQAAMAEWARVRKRKAKNG